jgi:hypothetical protein
MGEFAREFCACASISLDLPIFLHVRSLMCQFCFWYASSTTNVVGAPNISKGGTTIVANNNNNNHQPNYCEVATINLARVE